MNTLKPLFDTLWSQYERDNSQVPVIHQALKERNETIVNDHIAFRSFQSPNAGIDALAKVFL